METREMLFVREIMQTDVVTVSSDTTFRQVARLLADNSISGVPVLARSGRIEGVISSTDLVRFAAEDGGLRLPAPDVAIDASPESDADGDPVEVDPHGFFLPEDTPVSDRRLLGYVPESDFDTVTVGEIMTPVSFSVSPETSVPELCEYLVRGRIHRAVVMEDGRLLGIVTSADVLRAVADGRSEA